LFSLRAEVAVILMRLSEVVESHVD